MDIRPILQGEHVEKDDIYLPLKLGKTTVWDTLAASDLLDAATSATSEEHAQKKGRPQIDELIKEARNGVFLDLGCGYGRIAENLLPERTFDAYIGIDSSHKMLACARDRKKERPQHSTPMHWVYGEIDALPLKENSVDNVIVSAVFLHNHKSVTKNSIAEIERVLKPNGKLFVYGSFPNRTSFMGLQAAVYLTLMGIFGDAYRNGPVRYYSKGEVETLLKNFTLVSVRPADFAFLPKRILIFPNALNILYVRWIANPIHGLLKMILPVSILSLFPTHHDVLAVR